MRALLNEKQPTAALLASASLIETITGRSYDSPAATVVASLCRHSIWTGNFPGVRGEDFIRVRAPAIAVEHLRVIDGIETSDSGS